MKTRSALNDWLFLVHPPTSGPDGWCFAVIGQQHRNHGPFLDESTALASREGLFQRWSRAARTRGGWVWKSTAARWVVTVPIEVEVRGLAFTHAPCTRHC